MRGRGAQDLSENMGLAKLNARLQDPLCAAWFEGLFPRDSPRNMRFSINFFTSIGLGGLTDALRAHLKARPCRVVTPFQRLRFKGRLLCAFIMRSASLEHLCGVSCGGC